MDILSWVSILNIIVLLFSIYQVGTIFSEKRLAYLSLICLALVSYLISNIIFLVDQDLILIIRFVNLSSLVCVLSALFSLIRESKPVFARFPSILSYIPFLILLFLPLILGQTVIYNLLTATFQAGSILVALMIFVLNKLNKKDSGWHISGLILLLFAFVFYWFNTLLTPIQEVVITELVLLSGIVLLTTGIRKSHFKL
ncbi:MAG: hypothetical protein JJ892_03425 [Balneola sp.]|nr:hypothetical protein [Balneola sp.]MBO6650708.1 hypothetical protein [Balneola sp.]MBO6710620.1 hypothetical protein [Balneola sp.]MBO6799306.1 hypothetical protein [Balneola sp.]MBO6869565.1 hypothetical protein [Balneola sp.]